MRFHIASTVLWNNLQNKKKEFERVRLLTKFINLKFINFKLINNIGGPKGKEIIGNRV